MVPLAEKALEFKVKFENNRLNRDMTPDRLKKAHGSLMSEMAAAECLNVYFNPRVDNSQIGTADLYYAELAIDVKHTLYNGPTPKLIVSKEHDEHPNRFHAFMLMMGSDDLTRWEYAGFAWAEQILAPSRLDHSLPWPAYSMLAEDLNKRKPKQVA
tara:strand:- start:2780 stop:3247 length:468 start_codon:yes stop_codon:yes gene_type:complete